MTLDTSTKLVTYRILFSDLTGPTKMVHIHGLRPPSGGAPEVIMMRMDHPAVFSIDRRHLCRLNAAIRFG
jgi:hypothetical protein